MASNYKIAVVGLWHLGEIYSSGLASLGHQVIGISEDALVIENLSKNIPPLAEPRLEDLIKSDVAAGRLSFSGDFSKVKDCNVLWLTFDTPVDDQDKVDLSVIYDALEKSLPHLQNNSLIVITSQIPVGTSRKICDLISKKNPALKFDYVYTPENLRLGEAVKCFLEPGRIVVGADTDQAFSKISEIFSPLKTEILKMSVASAEMAKHALNAFLATSLSFINDVADVCEAVGADVSDVARALRSDPRIGQRGYVDASLGFSGGTLGRDLRALEEIARDKDLDLPVITNVYFKNKNRLQKVLQKLNGELGSLAGKTIALFGITYKAGTSTLRRSQALEVAALLTTAGAKVKMHDPSAEREDISKDPYSAADGAAAIVLMTPWPEFKNLDFKKLRERMQAPAVFYDTRNLLKDLSSAIEGSGLKYIGLGR
ncbi:MAG: nucleotide sugar dehydrogenase [Patescibacteria group bacterium]